MDNIRWLSVSEYAAEWNKDASTVRKWCCNAFALKLGYKLRRDPTGHWLIGVPNENSVKIGTSTLT